MSWKPALVAGPFDWALFGYHLNVVASAMTPEAAVAVVHPSSPEVVWAGDVGVPKRLHVINEAGVKTGTRVNPDWSASSPAFETVFCLFADEAEARALLPQLWREPPLRPSVS